MRYLSYNELNCVNGGQGGHDFSLRLISCALLITAMGLLSAHLIQSLNAESTQPNIVKTNEPPPEISIL